MRVVFTLLGRCTGGDKYVSMLGGFFCVVVFIGVCRWLVFVVFLLGVGGRLGFCFLVGVVLIWRFEDEGFKLLDTFILA